MIKMCRRQSFIVLCIYLLALLCVQAQRHDDGAEIRGWKLVWSEEFERSSLDTKHWSRCERGRADWNKPMSDDRNLLKIRGGVLRLIGKKNRSAKKGEPPYITAGISSKGKYNFQYGKVQIRARFKSAAGAWPALWMLGESGHWPANGEIDLMEHLNFDRHVHQTLHSTFTRSPEGRVLRNNYSVTKINRDRWNTYGCEWGTEKIVFTVNGQHTMTYKREAKHGDAQWPFKQPFFFILSMQIGGEWVNSQQATNRRDYPAWMEVDWVRVYKKKQETAQPKD